MSTRTVARAYAVEPGETPQPIEEAVADYDKSSTAAAAGFFLLPSLGSSLIWYDHHHTKLTGEKLDANLSLAKAIINAPIIPLSGGRFKFHAGGFVLTEIWLENKERVAVRKESHAPPKSVKKFEIEQCEDGVSESPQVSQWEFALKRLTTLGQDPVILIDGELTLQDIRLRAANLIRTSAEWEARLVLDGVPSPANTAIKKTGTTLTAEMKEDFVKLVGIYALAQALLTREEEASQSYDDCVQEHIRENRDSLNTIIAIFGFPQPDRTKRVNYLLECGEIGSRFTRSKLPDSQANNTWVSGTLHAAINCCFNALTELYCRDSFEEVAL